jgi:hypothetical protein
MMRRDAVILCKWREEFVSAAKKSAERILAGLYGDFVLFECGFLAQSPSWRRSDQNPQTTGGRVTSQFDLVKFPKANRTISPAPD